MLWAKGFERQVDTCLPCVGLWFPAQLQCVGRRAVPRAAGGWPTRTGCSVQGPSPSAQREARVRGRHPLAGPSAGQGARVLEDGEFEKPSKQTKMHKGEKPDCTTSLASSPRCLAQVRSFITRKCHCSGDEISPLCGLTARYFLQLNGVCGVGVMMHYCHALLFSKSVFGLCRAKKPHKLSCVHFAQRPMPCLLA